MTSFSRLSLIVTMLYLGYFSKYWRGKFFWPQGLFGYFWCHTVTLARKSRDQPLLGAFRRHPR